MRIQKARLISWDLIPQDSVLERTPLELFFIPPEFEENVTLWLEKLSVEIIDGGVGDRYLLESLDLFSVSSCTVSWLLAHCTNEILSALLEELKRIISECTGREISIRKELFSSSPFVDERRLFYLMNDCPPFANALMAVLGNACDEKEAITKISEASIFKKNGFTQNSIVDVGLIYTMAGQIHWPIEEMSICLLPSKYDSFAEYVFCLLRKHLKETEAHILLMHNGWVGKPLSANEIARKIKCTPQNVYRVLKLANEKHLFEKLRSEIQELASGIFCELYHSGGILPGEEISAVLRSQYGWSNAPDVESLERIFSVGMVKGVTFRNGWVAVNDRTCLPEHAHKSLNWSYYDQEITPDISRQFTGQPVEIDDFTQETTDEQLKEVSHELQAVFLPQELSDSVIPSDWVNNEEFAWLAAGAILSCADQRQLRGSKGVWSVAELQLSAQDFNCLRNWGATGTFSPRNLSKRIRVGASIFSGREALALLFIVYAAEVGRRDAAEGDLWTAVYESLGGGLKDFLMMHLSFGNVGPRPWLRSELERVFREYNLRHAFDGAGTQAWVKSIYLQFGFTQKGLIRLPWWLCGQQLPVAVQELLGKGSNGSASFVQFWQCIKEYRWKGVAAEELQQCLRENPWLPPAGIVALTRAATSKMHVAGPEGVTDAAARNESSSILGQTRLSISEGQPVFLVPLGDAWPDSLQDASYVLALGRHIRVSVERQKDGSYSLPAGDIAVDPVTTSLDVMLFSGGRSVLNEPIRYELWNEEEEFSFYRANGCKHPEERVKADGMPLYMICSADIELSSPADTSYALFNNAARLHYFKCGLPGEFLLSLEGEPFWSVPEPSGSKKKSASVKPIQALCMPVHCKWGEKARIHLSGIPSGIMPRRLLVGEMRLGLAGDIGNTAESEKFTAVPGMVALPPRGTLIGVEGGELRRFSVAITSNFAGVAVETAGGWALPDCRRIMDKAELQTSRILALPSDPPNLTEWGFTEGERFLARPSRNGDYIGQELIGLGAPLCFRRGPYNAVEAPIGISRAVIDYGVFAGAERIDQGWCVGLRHEQEFTDEFAVHIWYPDEPLPVTLKRTEWQHDCATRSIVVSPSSSHFDDPCSIALSFAGKCIGRTWCGMAAFHDIAKIIQDTPHWKETASWLAWWHAPVLIQEIRSAVADRVRSQAADTLVAWLGLSNDNLSPKCMTDVTLRMKDAIRSFFHEKLPDPGKSGEVLQSLQLVSGDWDLDESEAWESYDALLEISPIILAHLARTGASELYRGQPDKYKELMGLLRRRIASLGELDSDSDIVEVERDLLVTAARVMGVDEQFINRSLQNEARKLLRSEQRNMRNLEYCLEIQPLRDWIALRLLA